MTESGNLTKSEIQSITVRQRADTSSVYIEASATVDGQEVTVGVCQIPRGARKDESERVPVAQIAETIATVAQARKEEESSEEPTAL
jgi:hypothetical protein